MKISNPSTCGDKIKELNSNWEGKSLVFRGQIKKIRELLSSCFSEIKNAQNKKIGG